MKTVTRSAAVALLLATLIAGSAHAQIAPSPVAEAPAPAEQLVPAPFTAPIFSAPRLDDQAMAKETAREDISMIAQSRQASTVSGSSVSGQSHTGDLGIASTAFQDASGMILINANTGNNVAMNASMNVNIIMAGPQQP